MKKKVICCLPSNFAHRTAVHNYYYVLPKIHSKRFANAAVLPVHVKKVILRVAFNLPNTPPRK